MNNFVFSFTCITLNNCYSPKIMHSSLIYYVYIYMYNRLREHHYHFAYRTLTHYITDAVIEGLTQSNVADAKRRVDIIVWTNRGKERPTHFMSIPLIQPHIKERVGEFTTTVLESCRRVRLCVCGIYAIPLLC